jgi:hypothetical protein
MTDYITAKDIGGVLAGWLIATALLDTLMDKNLYCPSRTFGASSRRLELPYDRAP